jgi:hypothetical protein
MAKVGLTVEFDEKEVTDAILAKAKEAAGAGAGTGQVEFQYDDPKSDGISGAVVRFSNTQRKK